MMPGDEVLERLLTVMTEQFAVTCSTEGFRVTAARADRHGSIVWEAGRVDELNRYILLGMTQVPHDTRPLGVRERVARDIGDIEAVYEVELWIAADDNIRFMRMLFDRWYIYLSSKGPASPPETYLSRSLTEAFARVGTITREDLTEEYLVPRGSSIAASVPE